MPLKKPAELYINIEMINRNKTYKRSHKQSPKPVKNIIALLYPLVAG